MNKNGASVSLKESIAKLEAQQAEEKELLKEELFYVFEHLKPSNLIKDTVMDLVSTVHVKQNLMSTVLGTGAGYLASVVFGPKPTLLNKLGARFLQQAVNFVVVQNSQFLTDKALNLVTTLREKIERSRNRAAVSGNLPQNDGDAI